MFGVIGNIRLRMEIVFTHIPKHYLIIYLATKNCNTMNKDQEALHLAIMEQVVEDGSVYSNGVCGPDVERDNFIVEPEWEEDETPTDKYYVSITRKGTTTIYDDCSLDEVSILVKNNLDWI